MLCCVPRKVSAGCRGDDDALKRLDEAVLDVAKLAGSFELLDVQPDVLLPCSFCERTFNPRSLEKHAKICERSAIKKRKPFDSAKQRIQGTELAEFLPKQEPRANRHVNNNTISSGIVHNNHSTGIISTNSNNNNDDKSSSRRPCATWKQTHDEFLRAIRAARGTDLPITSSQHQHQQSSNSSSSTHFNQHQQHNNQQRPTTLSLVTSPGAPRKANEKGKCPTCQRQFGVKSYDRHVEFCRERSTRLPASPMLGSNVAKERLEARIKYKAPALKNRKPTNREKYSPSGGGTVKPMPSPSPVRANGTNVKKENAGQNCGKPSDANVTQKLPVLRRPGQAMSHSTSSTNGPLKSRASDRSISDAAKDYNPFLLAEQQLEDLFSDTSDLSSMDGSMIASKTSEQLKTPSQNDTKLLFQKTGEKRISSIEPPNGFDDFTSSELSSDCTETNSLSRENLKSTASLTANSNHILTNNGRVLGRRMIVEKSQALGCSLGDIGRTAEDSVKLKSERKQSSSSSASSNSVIGNGNNENHGSNLSLNSIISSDADNNKRLIDDLIGSFEEVDNNTNNLPSLRSLIRNDNNVSVISGNNKVNGHAKINGRCSEDELSSPESFKRQDRGKLSADSAYSSLNRKYSTNPRSPNEVTQPTANNKFKSNFATLSSLSKMSKFCHECGSRFPDLAKFCCECGVKRLTL